MNILQSKKNLFTIDKELYDTLKKYVSTDEARYFLQGVNVQHIDDTLYVCATDGKRIFLYEQKIRDVTLETENYMLVKNEIKKSFFLVPDTLEYTFPCYNKVLQDIKENSEKILGIDPKLPPKFSMHMNTILKSMPNAVLYDDAFYKDIPKGKKQDYSYKIFVRTVKHAKKVESTYMYKSTENNFTIVIMSLKK